MDCRFWDVSWYSKGKTNGRPLWREAIFLKTYEAIDILVETAYAERINEIFLPL